MTFKNKTIQKFFSILIIISMLTPAIFATFKPNKAEAWGIVYDPIHTVVTTKLVVQEIFKQFLMVVARRLLNKMTQNTIKWINSGFHGNPLYLERPGSFFKDIAKFEVRSLVDLFGYDSLRYPFGKDFSLNIINSYQRQLADNAAYSLSAVINDPALLESYRNDFNVGGWNGFLINTQYPQNNYIGFQMLATEEAARRLQGTVQNKTQQVQDTLQQGMGFLSPKVCPTNPKYNNNVNEFLQPRFDPSTVKWDPPFLPDPNAVSTDLMTQEEYDEAVQKYTAYKDEYDSALAIAKGEWADKNGCPGGLVSTTPGGVVGQQIKDALGSSGRRGELAQALGNSVAAILDTLMNHFMQKGLNALGDAVDGAGKPLIPPDGDETLDTFTFFGDTVNNAGTNNVPKPNFDPMPVIIVPGNPPGGGQCTETGNLYEGALRDAEDAVLAANPDVANLPNIESGGRQNARRFLALVETELIDRGFNATDEVLNGNNNPSTGDIIAVWRDGDTMMERYDAISGSASTIASAAMASFEGFVPFNCTTSGGGRECGCQTNVEPPTECVPPKVIENNACVDPTSTAPGSARIISISPTTAIAGTTTITINGTNLTNQISFYDGSGGRNTVVGTVNAAKTQTTVLVPANQPIRNATVKIYQGNQIWSNGILIAISNTGIEVTATEPSVDATAGFNGHLAFNPARNEWLVVSGGGGIFGRIMSNDRIPVTNQFTIDTTGGAGNSGGPKVVFAADMNKYIIVWISFATAQPTIYGRFINPDGTFSGAQFTIFTDPGLNSYLYPNSVLQYDSKNKKFVFVWEFRHPHVDSNLITISQAGVPGPVVDVGTDTAGGAWSPILAVNENLNEYCIAYTKGDGQTVAVKKYNVATGVLGPETIASTTDLGATGLVYNSVSRKYLIGWPSASSPISRGKILNSCNGTDASSAFTINDAGGGPSLAYNSKSNNYATIVQNQADFGNTYTILSLSGAVLKKGIAFAGSRNGSGGNFSPVITPNINDGTFGATSSIDYATTRFASQLGTASGGTSSTRPTIVKTIDLGAGSFPDPIYYQGRIWIAVQQDGLKLYSFASDLSDQKVSTIPSSSAGQMFQRLTVYNNILWLAFRNGDESQNIRESIKLWRSDTQAIEDLGAAIGNDPVALGNGYIAWNKWDGVTGRFYRRLLTGGPETFIRAGIITGISRILTNGSVVSIDADRTAVPWGLNAWFAGDLTVAADVTPNDDNGVVGRINNSPASEFNIWPNERTHTPHAATDGNGNYVVATWNPNVRVAVIRK